MSNQSEFPSVPGFDAWPEERKAAFRQRTQTFASFKNAPKVEDVNLSLVSDVDIMAGFFAQLVSDVDVAISLFKILGTVENLKAFGQNIVAYAQKGVALEKFKPEEVKKVYKVSKNMVYERMHSNRMRDVPVTPFNFGEMLAGVPGIKTKSHGNGVVTYTVAKGDYFVNFADNTKAYAQACTIMDAAQGMEANTIYHTYPYDSDVVIFCRLVALHYEVILGDSGLKLALKPVRAPPGCAEDIAQAGALLGKELHAAMDVYLDTPISVETISSQNVLAILYSMAIDNKFQTLYPSLFDTIMASRCMHGDRLNIFTGEDIDKEFDEWKETIKSKKVDSDFTRYKKQLADNVAWKTQVRAKEVDSHDWVVNGDYVHLPPGLWGVAHMIHLLLKMYGDEKLVNVEHIVLVGSRAANLAAALPFVASLKEWFDKLKTKRVYAQGKVEAVVGWNVVPYFKETVIEIPDSTETSRVLYLVSDFIEKPREVKPGESADISSLQVVVSAMKDKHGLLVCGYNLMNSGTLADIVDMLFAANFGLEVWKHPRYNNDHIYLIMQKGVELTVDLARQMYRWRMVSYANTIIKGECLWLGMQPTRKPGIDFNITASLFAALHVSELFKGEKKGVHRKYVGSDAHLLKILEKKGFASKDHVKEANPGSGKDEEIIAKPGSDPVSKEAVSTPMEGGDPEGRYPKRQTTAPREKMSTSPPRNKRKPDNRN